ncbi:MAG TPA: HAD family hydrolase [Bryobacteraceae bacterium]
MPFALSQYPVYIFDLDGTLMDSARDICGAIQEVLAANGRSDIPDTHLRRYIGRHLLDMFYDFGFTDEQIDPMIEHYRRIYPARQHLQTAPMPGVPEMLAGLGGRKTTATIKSTANTRIVLQQFGLLQYFEHVQGTDNFPSKPRPDVILHSMEALGAEPSECLMIGDSAADMEAGRAAGVKICGVRYGYGDLKEMAKWEPDYWIDDPRELL